MEFHCAFATLGSFPHCKWDCKWCWWMSCRWSFEGSLARNAFLRDSRCTKAYVFPYKVRPRTSMIYLCGATGARRSRVENDPTTHETVSHPSHLPLRCDGCETVSCVVGSCSDILGSVSDRFRIVNGVSTVFRACVVDRIPL